MTAASSPASHSALIVPERSIRVFICSTFIDMQRERDELVKFVFPRLRRLCEERGISWTDVDLRWGITDEERAEGRVLPICFAEIRKSRPFFVAILGERYGWVADEIPEAAIREEPWLEGMTGRSVTELEILHGVLRNPALAEHAYFYFRDPAYVSSLPNGDRTAFVESPLPAEIARFGEVEATRRADQRRERLATLKATIRERQRNVREGFGSPRDLGELVLADLTEAIDQLFPISSSPPALDRETAEHLRFAVRVSRSFAGRDDQLDQLDRHAAADASQPLVVTGEPGSGKSALLATWAVRYAQVHPSKKLLFHFVGARGTSSESHDVLRRLIAEFARLFEIDERVPADGPSAESEFAWWLALVNGRGRLVLVIDAVDRIAASADAAPLSWLPEEIPPNVRLIVSASSFAGDDLIRRGWQPMSLTPLPPDARRQLVESFFSRYAKELNRELLDDIVATPQTGSPLFLRSLLDELRVFGFADRLPDITRRYLRAREPSELLQQIFDRWEADYDRDQPGTVRDTLGLLAAARRGLSEPELLDLLGSGDLPMPRASWAPLFSAAEPFLFESSGILNVGEGQFADAVKRRYLRTDAATHAAHRRLARYFAHQPVGPRRVEEQPWHERLADLNALPSTLANRDLVAQAWRDGRQRDWISYWGSVARNVDPVAVHEAMIDSARESGVTGDQLSNLHKCAAELLRGLGRFDAAIRMMDRAREAADEQSLAPPKHVPAELGEANELADRGRAYLAAGRFAEAKEAVTQALGLRERLLGADHVVVATSLNDLGELYRRVGDAARAIPLHQRALRNRERALGPTHSAVAESLNNLACALLDVGNPAEAEPLLRRSLAIRRAVFGETHALTADGLNNVGHTLTQLGRSDEAVDLHRQALALRQQLFGEEHPSVAESFGNLGCALSALGNRKEAARCHASALRIAELVSGLDGAGVVWPLNNLATEYAALGRRAEAISLLRRAARIAEERLGTTHSYTELIRQNVRVAERL